jgi:alkylation response protein AidB-like acyl-CoA dehydrogenase
MIDAFRQDVRSWLAANCPTSMRTSMPQDEYPGGGRRARYRNLDTKLWLERMAAKGWTAPTWPVAYGGAGLDPQHHAVLQQELRRINARPPLLGMGLSMIGPALLEFGTAEQKAEHLPPIARGEIWWCQGYSEPNAGSDLASVRTRAVDAGDEYIINGSKIWTSGADQADWIFCLVRTDPVAPKHDGITFILFEMHQPGVTVRPIQLVSGASPFCETFFTDARASKQNVVGEIDKGWTVAKRLLQYERTSIGGIGSGTQAAVAIEDVAHRYLGADVHVHAMLRERIVRHRMNDRCFALTTRRAMEESASGRAPGAASSMFKYYGTEQNMRRYELLLAIMGTRGVGWHGAEFEAEELTTTRAWLRSKANSIEGGTSEIQLNIIAKRALGLPD